MEEACSRWAVRNLSITPGLSIRLPSVCPAPWLAPLELSCAIVLAWNRHCMLGLISMCWCFMGWLHGELPFIVWRSSVSWILSPGQLALTRGRPGIVFFSETCIFYASQCQRHDDMTWHATCCDMAEILQGYIKDSELSAFGSQIAEKIWFCSTLLKCKSPLHHNIS